jgi:hypothetical protein
MKYIERSGQKTIFHLGGLETDELTEGIKERVPIEEGSLLDPLKPPVARVEERSPKIAGRLRLEERKRVGEEGNGRVFKYPQLRLCPAQSDFVR